MKGRAARHRTGKKADGGRINMKVSGNPDVFKEAEERKRGGRTKGGLKVHGNAAKHRLDRPGRKAGGRVGANAAPLSTANRGSKADNLPHENEGPHTSD